MECTVLGELTCGVGFERSKSPWLSVPAMFSRKNSFSVRVRGNRYTVIVNDETIFDGEEIHAKWGDVAPTRVGLGGSYSSVPNYKAKFRAMKIRRLPDENKPVAGKTEPVG